MVDTKISALIDGAPILGTDELVLARSGGNVKADVSDLLKAGVNNTLFISTVDITVSNTVTETTLVPTGVGSVIIPAAKLNRVGVKFSTTIQGIISDTGNPTFQLRVNLGALEIGNSTINSLGSISDDHWRMDVEFVVRTIGVTGTIMATGGFVTAKGDHFSLINTTELTLNTTIDQTLDVTAQWGTANAANTVVCQIMELHEVNV